MSVSTPSRFRSISLFQKRNTPKALLGKILIALRVAPRVQIEIMLTAIDLYNQTLLETDEIDEMAIARGLATELKSSLSPGAQMNPQLDLLRCHSFAKAAGDFVSHLSPPGLPATRGGIGARCLAQLHPTRRKEFK